MTYMSSPDYKILDNLWPNSWFCKFKDLDTILVTLFIKIEHYMLPPVQINDGYNL